jgi:hypothetical protein
MGSGAGLNDEEKIKISCPYYPTQSLLPISTTLSRLPQNQFTEVYKTYPGRRGKLDPMATKVSLGLHQLSHVGVCIEKCINIYVKSSSSHLLICTLQVQFIIF